MSKEYSVSAPEEIKLFERDLRVVNLIKKNSDIALDLDQILLECRVPGIREACKLYGLKKVDPLATGWNYVAKKLMEKGFAEGEALRVEHLIWTDPEVLKKSPLVEGALELSWQLQLLSKRQFIVTSRTPQPSDIAIPPKIETITRQSIMNIFPWIPQERVFINSNPFMDRVKFKKEVAGKFPIYIEDHASYALGIVQNSPLTTVILINAVKGEDNSVKHDRIICLPSVSYLATLLSPLVAQS